MPIKNKERFGQKIRFPRLDISATLTDVDFALEKDNRLFIFGEVKTAQNNLSAGQKLFFERIVDAINQDPDKEAIFLLVWHKTPPGQEILLEQTICSSIYTRKGWQIVNFNTLELLNGLLERNQRILLGRLN